MSKVLDVLTTLFNGFNSPDDSDDSEDFDDSDDTDFEIMLIYLVGQLRYEHRTSYRLGWSHIDKGRDISAAHSASRRASETQDDSKQNKNALEKSSLHVAIQFSTFLASRIAGNSSSVNNLLSNVH